MVKKLTVSAILMAILFLNFGDLVHRCKMTGEFVWMTCACEAVTTKKLTNEKHNSCSSEKTKEEKIITQTTIDDCCLNYAKMLPDFTTTGIEFVLLKKVTLNFNNFFIADRAILMQKHSSIKEYRGPPISQNMAFSTTLQVLYCTYLI